MKHMDWQDLRHFLAVAESGSLAGAARRMQVSKATVWRHVRSLQDFLGVSLFETHPTGQFLTPAGKRFMSSIVGINRTIDNACQAVLAEPTLIAGEVRVTAPELIGIVVIRALPALLETHPGIALELVTGSPASSLAARDTDISLRFDAPRSGGFARIATIPVPFGVFAAPSYLERFGVPDRLDDFSGHRLIAFEHSLAQLAPKAWLQRGGRNADIVFRSNSPHTRLAAARDGVGLALLAESFAAGEPGLLRVLDSGTVGGLELLVLVSNELTHEPRVVAVRDFLCDVLNSSTVR